MGDYDNKTATKTTSTRQPQIVSAPRVAKPKESQWLGIGCLLVKGYFLDNLLLLLGKPGWASLALEVQYTQGLLLGLHDPN